MNGNSPLYEKVYRSIRSRIENGDYSKGSLLPTESELQKMFNVSRVTIRKAVEMLSSEGFVFVRQGRGTEVLEHRTSQKLNNVSSFMEALIEKGYRAGSKNSAIERMIPSTRVLDELELPHNTMVTRLYRIRTANEHPIAIMINYILSDIVPNLEDVYADERSLYSIIENHFHVRIDSAMETIGARVASVSEAELLQIPEGSPLLVSRRITFSNGKPIEVVISTIVADRFEYSIFLKGRSS